MPNDALFGQLWGMHNTGQNFGMDDADIDAPEAWELSTGSSDILVAVIDTGIDYTHPDLSDNIWINPGEAGVLSANGVDDDDNGFVDDYHGWDFYNDDNDPMDDDGHGTHCAGTIGAAGDNQIGVAGVCWDISLIERFAFTRRRHPMTAMATAYRTGGKSNIMAGRQMPFRRRPVRMASTPY